MSIINKDDYKVIAIVLICFLQVKINLPIGFTSMQYYCKKCW